MKQKSIRKHTLLRIYAFLAAEERCDIGSVASALHISRDASAIGLYTLVRMHYAKRRRYADSGVYFYPDKERKYTLLFLCGYDATAVVTDGSGNCRFRLRLIGDSDLLPDENLHIFLKNLRIALDEDGYTDALSRTCLMYRVTKDGVPMEKELSLFDLSSFCKSRLGIRHLTLLPSLSPFYPSQKETRLQAVLAVMNDRIMKKKK